MPQKPAAAEAEEIARAINAEPWEPLAGMVKRQCPRCRYFLCRRKHGSAPRSGSVVVQTLPLRRLRAYARPARLRSRPRGTYVAWGWRGSCCSFRASPLREPLKAELLA